MMKAIMEMASISQRQAIKGRIISRDKERPPLKRVRARACKSRPNGKYSPGRNSRREIPAARKMVVTMARPSRQSVQNFLRVRVKGAIDQRVYLKKALRGSVTPDNRGSQTPSEQNWSLSGDMLAAGGFMFAQSLQ